MAIRYTFIHLCALYACCHSANDDYYYVLYLSYTLLIQKIHTHTSITLHTDYIIHDKYNADYVKYKHTHTHISQIISLSRILWSVISLSLTIN